MDDYKAEDLFLEADQLIDDDKVIEAKNILINLLADFPDYGRAHNHLGWLYSVKFYNFDKAKNHLEHALKFAPDYQAVYANYAYLLVEMNLFDEMIAFGLKYLPKGVADAGVMYNKMGQAFELKGDLKNAHKYYRLSVNKSINNQFLEELYASLYRVRRKMNIFQKFKTLKKF